MSSRRSFLASLGTFLLAGNSGQRRNRWEMITNSDPVAVPALHPNPSGWEDSTITAAWIGHSTVLINFLGTNIITDPVFSDRIGFNIAGLFTVGPRRLVYPALAIDQLPRIDLILLSHAHFDHLDVPSLEKFNRTVPVIMARNTADVIENLEFSTIYELDWGKWTAIGDLRVEALQVKHFGWRYPWELDRSRGNPEGRSYNAYLLSKHGHHIVFGGDTAYQEHFKLLHDRSIGPDLAIMPIGAYDPWIQNHANPEQALAMADQMGSRNILPIHWNTFIQSEEPTAEPMERLKQAAYASRIVIDSIGQTWSFSGDLRSIPVQKTNPAGADSTGLTDRIQ